MQANIWRGEVAVILDGKSYVMRPTFEALQQIEQELKTGLIALARKITSGTVTLEELAVIIAQCTVEKISLDAVKASLIRSGILQGLVAVADMFAQILGELGDAETS